MRRASKEYKNSKQELINLRNMDMGLRAIYGRSFNEQKIAALTAFLIKLKPYTKYK